jgi:hypothetical protein
MADKHWIQKAVPKSHKGLFTAKAKKAGMSVSEYASHVLKAGSGASTKTKRQAALARRFEKGI